MTRDEARALRDVFNAFCDGKEIQYRYKDQNGCGVWKDTDVYMQAYELRVKPKPRWVVVYKDQQGNELCFGKFFKTEEEACEKLSTLNWAFGRTPVGVYQIEL